MYSHPPFSSNTTYIVSFPAGIAVYIDAPYAASNIPSYVHSSHSTFVASRIVPFHPPFYIIY